jgi:predicted DNA-binding transcriptional regulator YafY
MQKFKPQYRRLLFIDRKIRENSYPNCVSLAKEWEVSDKTIQRDIDYLRDQLEAPIAYDQLRHGYYYTERNFSLPAINISESDLFAVFVAERAMGQFRNTPMYGKLRSVFAKIKDSLPDSTKVSPSWLSDRILCFQEPVTNIDVKIWDTLAKAIRDNRRLHIKHNSPGRKITAERKVDPYYLVNFKGEWYLNTWCHARNSIRTFAVSRIRKAEMLTEQFTMPASVTREKIFGDQLGIIWKPDFHTVRIRFSAEVAPYIRERQWHPLQNIKELSTGGLILEFTTNHLNEVKDWILSWGAAARAMGPAELVDKVQGDLKEALQGYRR